VAVIAAGGPSGVDVWGWDELGYAVVGDVDLPAVVVDDVVVMSAEQHAVVDGGAAAVGVTKDVVPVAPASVALGK